VTFDGTLLSQTLDEYVDMARRHGSRVVASSMPSSTTGSAVKFISFRGSYSEGLVSRRNLIFATALFPTWLFSTVTATLYNERGRQPTLSSSAAEALSTLRDLVLYVAITLRLAISTPPAESPLHPPFETSADI
jgi:hypothetical protein